METDTKKKMRTEFLNKLPEGGNLREAKEIANECLIEWKNKGLIEGSGEISFYEFLTLIGLKQYG